MNRKARTRLWLVFTAAVFAFTLLMMAVVWLALYGAGLAPAGEERRRMPVLLLCFGSILLGGSLALFVGRVIIQPILTLIRAFDELSRGNFAVQVPEESRIVEIREMNRHFNAMAYDLGHMETLRSDFVAGVSHEFKTPLAVIEGYATLLQNPGLPWEKREHYHEIILDNARRLSALSGNILTLSKLENQGMVVDRHAFRLDEQLREAILSLEQKWAAKEVVFDPDLPCQMYEGSEALLAQVWSNLLDNAVKNSPAGGVIRVALRRQRDWLAVEVADQGPGMSEEVQKHIFEKFYQGDPSRKAEGSGLGLALVRRIVDLCQGRIEVESAPGKGAKFTVFLPL